MNCSISSLKIAPKYAILFKILKTIKTFEHLKEVGQH